MLEDSLRKYGAGRSILADKNLRVLAGNKTLEAAAAAGFDKVAVVKSDGHTLVVVQRDDLDLDDPKARELAIADNRIGEVNLDWDANILSELVEDGVDLSGLFELDEIAALEDGESVENPGPVTVLDQAIQLEPAKEYVVVMCADPEEWERLKKALRLGEVRKGGYKHGSPFDKPGTERVIHAADLLEIVDSASRDTE